MAPPTLLEKLSHYYFSIKEDLQKRWQEDKYIPLATEACGVYEIIMGSAVAGYIVADAIKNGSFNKGDPITGLTYKGLLATIFKEVILDGCRRILPASLVLYNAYQLNNRSITVLYASELNPLNRSIR
jgi:hypothetical protein